MRFIPVLFVGFALGCTAAVARAPEHRYRVSGMAFALTPTGRDDTSYRLQLQGGVEYSVRAVVASGEVRLRTVVRNGGRAPVRYDPLAAVVAGADGGPLRLVSVEEEPSSPRPSEAEQGAKEYVRGVRAISPGQSEAIARRYALADGVRRGRDLHLLAMLSLGDLVRVGDVEVPVLLRLKEMR
jgi:hypothetical protein